MSGPLDFDPPVAEPPESPPRPPDVRPTGPPPPARPPGASRYGWLVGVIVFVFLVYITFNTLRSHHLAAAGPPRGAQLPGFAAPLVLSGLEGNPNNCSVRLRGAVNLCDVARRGPVVLAFLFTRGAQCAGTFDAMQRLSATTPGVQYVGVIIKGGRDADRQLVRQHGWTFPVAYDEDGRVANAYGVAGCPEVVFAYPGGKVRGTVLGRDRAERQLGAHVRGLEAASRRLGWRPPG